MNNYQPGSVVRVRNREWVVLPSQDEELLMLRPLVGGEHECMSVFLPLGLDTTEPASFPLPDPTQPGDFASARLLLDAARLNLRNGAGPFRSVGRISVRPRPYQFVPLLMALRLDPIRLLIADDVGIGKTIEAGLIAREMLDRGEISRLAVLCPPYLCDQWQQELQEKFHLPAVVVRSGTISRLERELPSQGVSIFEHFPYMVVSIDFAKSERHRASFLLHCPDFVIVDEAHIASRPAGRSTTQQLRHNLVRELADKANRHLLLLTATPHSGIEESFKSLLGLLRREFEAWDLSSLTTQQRDELARHFVQRRRADVAEWMGEKTPFPTRVSTEAPYQLHPDYLELANKVYEFARELIRSGESLRGFQRRVRYWTALALMRCVLSSPAAAEAALERQTLRRPEGDEPEPDDAILSPYVYDTLAADEASIDLSPAYVVEEGQRQLSDYERRRLRDFARLAHQMRGEKDRKVQEAARQVATLLEKGRQVIVYCRYIATADYVAGQLSEILAARFPDTRILSVTGALAEDERRERVAELTSYPRRVLVATDCLSEGINLQEGFDAVVHYDLPWNPNRLEQREGRVDRYGQPSETVDTVLLYGQDNPVDGAVLDVLIRKAVEIRRVLGITVPVPIESESVIEAVVQSLFKRGPADTRQLTLPAFEDSPFERVEQVHAEWYERAEREKRSRTRFAQHAIKPNEVERELEETDAVLGDPETVRRFVLQACQRLDIPLVQNRAGYRLDPTDVLRGRLALDKPVTIAFTTPAPEGTQFVGRNHPLTASLAELVLTTALTPDSQHAGLRTVMRCGATRTDVVAQQTTLLLLRIRHLLRGAERHADALAEECVVAGFQGLPPAVEAWLTQEQCLELLDTVRPAGDLSPAEMHRRLEPVIEWLSQEPGVLDPIAQQRAKVLQEAHSRVRKAIRMNRVIVSPAIPVDVLGVYVLIPLPR